MGLHYATTVSYKPRQIWAIRFLLDQHGRGRDLTLFDLAIDSKLRGCDLVKISISVSFVIAKFEHAPRWYSKRPEDRFNLN